MELAELGLYGGTVKGLVVGDGSGEGLGIDVTMDVNGVVLDRLAELLQAPIGGIATGTLSAKGRGVSARELVSSLAANVDMALAGMDPASPMTPGISELSLTAALDGLEGAPTAKASTVYNGEPMTVTAMLSPLREVLGADRFDADLALVSAPVSAAYKGAIQQRPAPGLEGEMSVDIGSVGALAAWLGQPLPEGQADPGPLSLAAKLATDDAGVTLEEASAEGNAFAARAQGRFETAGEVPKFTAALTVDRLDLDALLPQPPTADGSAPAAEGGAAAPAAASDWSDDPIDVAALHAAVADITLEAANVIYQGLTIDAMTADAKLEGGVLKAVLHNLSTVGGAITAGVDVDGSGNGVALAYDVNAEGLQALPLLSALADFDTISGTMAMRAQGRSRGVSERDIVSALNGDGAITFTNGAIEGIDIPGTIRSVGNFGGDEVQERPRTDFSELSGTYTITDGVVDNRDLRMLAPLVRMDGAGLVPMPPRTVDYDVTLKLVASLEGQGGDDALAGVPIPVAVTGPWHQPGYEVNWQSVFNEIALDPAKVAALPANLAETALGLGVELPVAILEGVGGGVGAVLEEVLPVGEGEGPLSILEEVLPIPAPEVESEGLPDPVGAIRDLMN